MNPPVGPATIAGLVAAVTGFALAIVAFVVPDPVQQQQLGAVVSAGVGALALAITMIGRYIQAQKAVPKTLVTTNVPPAK